MTFTIFSCSSHLFTPYLFPSANDYWFQQYDDDDAIIQNGEEVEDDETNEEVGEGSSHASQLFMHNLREEITNNRF
mgnify:CR=1 FL=1